MKLGIGIIMVLVLAMLIGGMYKESPNMTINEVKEELSPIHNSTFSILDRESLTYHNLYEEEVTVTSMLSNTLHGLAYVLIVIVNTLVPTMVTVMKDSTLLLKLLILVVVLLLIPSMISIITGILTIIMFIHERRKYKEKITD